MKKMLILLVSILSLNIYSENLEIKNIDKKDFNQITNEVCKGIYEIELENYKKMACLKILNKGLDNNNFNSMYILYKALSSKINFNNDYDLEFLKQKMKNIKNLTEEQNLLINKL